MSDRFAYYPDFYGNPDWFLHARFGLFVHWGLYALPARHEWVMTRELTTPENYKKYFEHFEPDLFDPQAWAKTAKAAGMKYVVFTTKHHEGFAMWDSQLTDYKVTNTPIGRDLLKEVVTAFRDEGIKIGLYYSLIDWHHRDFPIDGLHPLREDEEAKAKNNERDMSRYAEYMHGQVKELLTGYGKIDYLWFDFSYPHRDWGFTKGKGAEDWQSEKLEKMVLELQPHILINDRLGLHRGVTTPEQYQPSESLDGNHSKRIIWEACQTMNDSWGYDRDNKNFKSAELLIKMLIDTVSKGGNMLLNVGPNGRGEWDSVSVERLESIGTWMRLHQPSIYGAGRSAFVAPPDCRYTQKSDRLYLHLFSWPFKNIHLEGLAGKVTYARFLHDHSEVGMKTFDPEETLTETENNINPNDVMIILPVIKPDVPVPVIELFLKE
ncbi:alpha-L-fucosidase [Camelliibacillus cellulosilyticus]|uniref:alpha-L-fucosidase n=1 Tax=Camelliibacillus cellulosilyticus TaxID=2174486 RepID=A0ABV9GLK8_9BACL